MWETQVGFWVPAFSHPGVAGTGERNMVENSLCISNTIFKKLIFLKKMLRNFKD